MAESTKFVPLPSVLLCWRRFRMPRTSPRYPPITNRVAGSNDAAVIDANVLVYAFWSDAEHHGPSRRLLESSHDPAATLCVTSQVLAEFFSVVTNGKRVAIPRTPGEAIDAILALPGVVVLPVPPSAVFHWLELLRRRPVTGAMIFDIQLAATMPANDALRIYGYNRRDFERFAELAVVTP